MTDLEEIHRFHRFPALDRLRENKGVILWKGGNGRKGEKQSIPILQTMLAIIICLSLAPEIHKE